MIIAVNMVTLPEPQMWGEMCETDLTQKRRPCHIAISQIIKALAILRCLHGTEAVLQG